MTITLPPDQQAWLEKQVAAGLYATVDEAAHAAIDVAMVETALSDADDLSWAKPYIEAAREEVARGEVMTLEEHNARISSRLKELLDR